MEAFSPSDEGEGRQDHGAGASGVLDMSLPQQGAQGCSLPTLAQVLLWKGDSSAPLHRTLWRLSEMTHRLCRAHSRGSEKAPSVLLPAAS